ncbi:unnamed protein product [Anisakis simplex]|uniref:G patch domain-containing protein 11 n=1 Tax=Anisakis simplex TaxID=6269 RepID=A0A0M3JUS2_ANISI|nr:unnamed protein product [Anisakis simplex]
MHHYDGYKLMNWNEQFCEDHGPASGTSRSWNEGIANGIKQEDCSDEDKDQEDKDRRNPVKVENNDEDGDEENDDYMSDVFTATTSDIRPGIAISHSQRRILKIESERKEYEERLKSQPKRAELEREMREKALQKPISSESKGFALLAKMGYKPGMSLGKQKEEYFATVYLKQFLFGDYQSRQRAASAQKQLIGDIMKSRKACQDLDLRNGLELPKSPYFWPIYKEKSTREALLDVRGGAPSSKRAHIVGVSEDGYECVDDDYESNDDGDDDEIYKYPNGKLAPAERELNELNETELMDRWICIVIGFGDNQSSHFLFGLRLEDLTAYLREEHNYCVWCGCQYESNEELSTQCPGSTRCEHEEDGALDE